MNLNKILILIVILISAVFFTVTSTLVYDSNHTISVEIPKTAKYKEIHKRFLSGEQVTEKEILYMKEQQAIYSKKRLSLHEEKRNQFLKEGNKEKHKLNSKSYLKLSIIWLITYSLLLFFKALSNISSRFAFVVFSSLILLFNNNLLFFYIVLMVIFIIFEYARTRKINM